MDPTAGGSTKTRIPATEILAPVLILPRKEEDPTSDDEASSRRIDEFSHQIDLLLFG
jgi:hypothetical protein